MDFGLILLVFLIQVVSYGVKGLVGFGNSMISAPLLSMMLDSSVVAPSGLIMDIPVNSYITFRNRAHFAIRSVLPLMVTNLLGVIPGILLLRHSGGEGQWALKAVLGVLVLGLGAMLGRGEAVPLDPRVQWLRYPVAFVSGVCSGLFGINMLFVAFLKRTAHDYDEFKGSMCFLFLAENLFRFFVSLAAGLMTKPVWLLGAIAVPAAILGTVGGMAVSARLPEEKLNRYAVAMFLLCGASVLFKALVFHT